MDHSSGLVFRRPQATLTADLWSIFAPPFSRLVRPSAARGGDRSTVGKGKRSAEHEREDKAAIRAAINTMKGNLRFLWEQMDPAVRARARAWYLGGHRLAGEFADEFGTTLAQMAGVIAAQSPQKDWNQNISLARRVLETMTRLDAKDSALPREIYRGESRSLTYGVSPDGSLIAFLQRSVNPDDPGP